VGDAAVGVRNTAQWSPDLDNPANVAFVEAFQAEYGRLPSLYASQGFDTANLILSAMAKADVSDADAFRAALREADFASTRGDFAFGPNHHPIQDIYVREVVKDGDVITNRIVGVALEDRGDAYAEECKM
jgi:branched-chain amino acid transport system substrate-binding protein